MAIAYKHKAAYVLKLRKYNTIPMQGYTFGPKNLSFFCAVIIQVYIVFFCCSFVADRTSPCDKDNGILILVVDHSLIFGCYTVFWECVGWGDTRLRCFFVALHYWYNATRKKRYRFGKTFFKDFFTLYFLLLSNSE